MLSLFISRTLKVDVMWFSPVVRCGSFYRALEIEDTFKKKSFLWDLYYRRRGHPQIMSMDRMEPPQERWFMDCGIREF